MPWSLRYFLGIWMWFILFFYFTTLIIDRLDKLNKSLKKIIKHFKEED
jgi:hypothetical protein